MSFLKKIASAYTNTMGDVLNSVGSAVGVTKPKEATSIVGKIFQPIANLAGGAAKMVVGPALGDAASNAVVTKLSDTKLAGVSGIAGNLANTIVTKGTNSLINPVSVNSAVNNSLANPVLDTAVAPGPAQGSGSTPMSFSGIPPVNWKDILIDAGTKIGQDVYDGLSEENKKKVDDTIKDAAKGGIKAWMADNQWVWALIIPVGGGLLYALYKLFAYWFGARKGSKNRRR